MDRKWWTLVAVSVGTFMLLLDVTIVNVALPAIQSGLKASFSDLQWVVDAYALMLAALLLTTGSLADMFGRRRLFVIGLVVFSISSLLSGLAQDPLWLNLARGAQGVGGAAMFSTSLALLGTSFQGPERGVAFGVWGAITGVAVALGPVIGGALTTGISWRWIFLVNVPIGVVGVLISLWRVDESKQPNASRPDLLGAVLFSGALAALVYALIEGDSAGWTSTKILACLGGAAGLLVLFLAAEIVQGERALFDLRLFRKPTFTGGSLAAFALSAGLFSLLLYLTLYFQDVLGYSALQTGLRFLVLSGGILLTSTLAGRLTAFVPIRFLISPGLLLVAVGLFLMHGLDASSRWTHLIPGFIVAGAGTGLINPPLASTAIGVVTPDRAGMASGINSTFRQVGIATGIAGLGSIFTHKVRLDIVSLLKHAPGISGHQAAGLARGVAQGGGAVSGISALPAKARPAAAHAVRASFTSGLNEVFLVGAGLAVVVAALTLVLIRSKDFEVGSARSTAGPAPQGGPASQPSASGAAAATAPAAQWSDGPTGDVTLTPVGEEAREAAASAPPEPLVLGPSAGVEQTSTRLEPVAAHDSSAGATLDADGREDGRADDDDEHDDEADWASLAEEEAPAPTLERLAAAAERTRSAYPDDPEDATGPGSFSSVGNGMGGPLPPTTVHMAAQAAGEAEQAALDYAREIGQARRHLASAAQHLEQANAARARLDRLAQTLGTVSFSPALGDAETGDEAPWSSPASGVSPADQPRVSEGLPVDEPLSDEGGAGGEPPSGEDVAGFGAGTEAMPVGETGSDEIAAGDPGSAAMGGAWANGAVEPAPNRVANGSTQGGAEAPETGRVPPASGFRRF